MTRWCTDCVHFRVGYQGQLLLKAEAPPRPKGMAKSEYQWQVQRWHERLGFHDVDPSGEASCEFGHKMRFFMPFEQQSYTSTEWGFHRPGCTQWEEGISPERQILMAGRLPPSDG